MASDRQYRFACFRLDARTGELWRDGVEAKVTPRAAAVLALLAERAQQLVTKRELFDRIWDGMAVGDDALTSCIQELRGTLGDDARRPKYIETLHRRGYRLMVPVTADASGSGTPAVTTEPAPTRLVGRGAELAELSRCFAAALSGHRQVVFVTGEPGIGKSALADEFVEQLRPDGDVRIAHGQCVDHHGVGEPYLPLIEALTRLASASDGNDVRGILAERAPSWLAQMPSLWSHAKRDTLEARGRSTRERMLRELTEAVEAIAARRPLLLRLEDVHWSDASTLDWLAHVARRPEPARLMLLATFRPANTAAIRAGLDDVVAEMAVHGLCREIALSPLELQAVEAYLQARLGDRHETAPVRNLAPILLERTGGNPLFMVSIVNQLAQLDAAAAMPGAMGAIPHDVRRFIERQIDELDESERNLLAAASVIGRTFVTAAVAAALDTDVEPVEADCARLARQGVFVLKSDSATWPDGTVTELYAFRHDLYRELLYERLSATKRAQGHARVGRRLETAWHGRLDVVAAELAEHFERGNELARAIPHHQRAAAKALRRSANQEAIGHLRRALDSIDHVLDENERTRVEVELRVGMGAAYMAMRGFGAPEVLEAYSRAEALCERLGERVDLFPAIWGQWMFRTGRGETAISRRLGARLLGLADRYDDAGLKIQAHHAMWSTSFVCGELTQACAHARSGLALFNAKVHQAMASNYGNHDAGCCARNFSAMALALAGDDDGAQAMIDQSVAAARNLGDPFSLALTLYFTAAAAQMLGDVTLASENSALCAELAAEHGLAQPQAWSMGVAGWCAAENGDPVRGAVLATQAVATMRAIQSRHFLPYLYGLLTQVHLLAGQYDDAMKAGEDGIAIAKATGEHFYSAELHRLRGELLTRMSSGDHAEAESSFRTAIEIARGQGARTLERRAGESLRRWCR